jgi:hypothetical protein
MSDPFAAACQSGAIRPEISDLCVAAARWHQPSRIKSIAAELALAIGGGRAASDIIANVVNGTIASSADVPVEAFLDGADASWGVRPATSRKARLHLVGRAVSVPTMDAAAWIGDVGGCEATSDSPSTAPLIAAIKYRLIMDDVTRET